MKKITISTPDGKTLTLNAPDGATPDQIKQYATQAISKYKTTMAPKPAAPAEAPQPQPKERGMVGKAWDALNVPAQMSKQGLTQLADLRTQGQNMVAEKTGLPIGTEPTGNLARDVVANIPRIADESVAEVAPAFVDGVSILTAGAGGAAKAGGKLAGKIIPHISPALEAGSGLGKGTLVAAFKDPKMIVDFGAKLKASKLYNSIKEGASVPRHLQTNAKVVSDAMNKMAQGKVLTAPDAFRARKAVNALMKSKQYPMDDLIKTKEGLEAMVYSSVKEADKMYIRAIRGENMRQPMRLNKNGSTNMLAAGATAAFPWLAQISSPLVQGGAASLAGAAAQMPIPEALKAGGMISAGLDRLKKKKEKKRGND